MIEIPAPVAKHLDRELVGVLATVGKSGRPRQSVVYFARVGSRLLISTEAGRLKAKDVEREGWASLCVHATDRPFASATLAGTARIRKAGIGLDTALVMQRIAAMPEPPEPQTDEALAEVGRVLLEIEVEKIGPVAYVDDEDGKT